MTVTNASTAFATLVDAAFVHAHLADPAMVVLDVGMRRNADSVLVSSRGDYELARIPRARFLDIGRDLSAPGRLHFMLPDAAQFATAMTAAGVTDTSSIVVYSRDRIWWATRAWFVLRAFGLRRVAVLDGGFAAWRDGGYPVESGPPPASAAARFTPRAPNRAAVAVREDVLRALAAGGVVANALSPAQHSGAETNHYSRPGRIAGSINLPGAALLDGAGRFLPPARLAEMLAPALGRDAITYCGGGVTATAVTFALALLGHPSRVYDGSLEEWSADAALPMETG
jgi:thiosulfate/3-mercaptopyruvate sulfurtransferase